MRIIDNGNAVILYASAQDTYNWANKPGGVWPCSTLADKRFCACFDTNGLYDLTIDGKDTDDIDKHELSAICADLLRERIKPGHPVYLVTVGDE